MSRPSGRNGLAWMAVPFAVYGLVLWHLGFDAPISDDFDIALAEVMRMSDAAGFAQWLGIVVAQHNEHRIVVMRVVAWLMAALTGHIDFRTLSLLGNLTVLGLCILAWAEFREAVAAPLFMAAAFLVLQWSYYEASLMATAALPNIGVVFFASACLFFAVRDGTAAAALSVLFGLLAVGSQANGLFALPLAAGACALTQRRARAFAFGAIAIVLWLLYFLGYEHPGHHPSPFFMVAHPIAAIRFFLMVLGSIVPGLWLSAAVGAALVGVVAWLGWRGAWKRHPAAALCVSFVLVSAAAVTAGRVGLGVMQSSRYAVYSTWLVALAFLAVCAELKVSGRRIEVLAIAAAASVALLASAGWWHGAREFSVAGHMLFKAVPASRDVIVDRYLYTLHPNAQASRGILHEAERRGLYAAPERLVYAAAFRSIAAIPAGARLQGAIDEIAVAGNRVKLTGWSDIGATTKDRTLAVYPAEPAPSLARYEIVGRPDVAMALGDAGLVAAGFRAELEYPSQDAARRAAQSLCVVVEAPSRPPELLRRAGSACAAGR